MQPKYTVFEWSTFGNRGHLSVEVEGFPGWAVNVAVMQIESGMAITDLSVKPLQVTRMIGAAEDIENMTASIGSRILAEGEWPPESGWSELAVDVPAGGIPARLIRAINVGQLLALAQRQAGEAFSVNSGRAERFNDAGNKKLAAQFLTQAHESRALSDVVATSKKRQGRRGNGIDHYLDWAVRYAAKSEMGVFHPIKALADEYHKTPTYVRDTVTDARRRYGFLTKPGQGRAGGTLTEKALMLLRERQNEED